MTEISRSALFGRLAPSTLKSVETGEGFNAILAGSSEASEGGALGSGAGGGGGGGSSGDGEPSGDSALAKFSVDLTARARSGEIDKIVGRDAEIRQCIDILLRRRQN